MVRDGGIGIALRKSASSPFDFKSYESLSNDGRQNSSTSNQSFRRQKSWRWRKVWRNWSIMVHYLVMLEVVIESGNLVCFDSHNKDWIGMFYEALDRLWSACCSKLALYVSTLPLLIVTWILFLNCFCFFANPLFKSRQFSAISAEQGNQQLVMA